MSKSKYEIMENKLVDASVERNLPNLVEDWFIEYVCKDVKRSQMGWYLLSAYPRYFGDMGIYLGFDYKTAVKELEYWLQLIE